MQRKTSGGEIVPVDSGILPEKRRAERMTLPIQGVPLEVVSITKYKKHIFKLEKGVAVALRKDNVVAKAGTILPIVFLIVNRTKKSIGNIEIVVELEGPVHLNKTKKVVLRGVQSVLDENGFPILLESNDEYKNVARFRVPSDIQLGEYTGTVYPKFD